MSATRANPPDTGFPNEIRARLAEWKRLPESSRPTLRSLAQELGPRTSS